MKFKFLLGVTVLLIASSFCFAQQTRTFSDADCKYTLPGKDWEWLDPQMAPPAGTMQCLVFAKNQSGMGIVVRTDLLKPGEKLAANRFESFEAGFIKGGKMKKLSGAPMNFRGISAYQIDAELPGGMGNSCRLMYANNRLYVLNVINGLGPLPAAQSDVVYEGFDFTSTPQPVAAGDTTFEAGYQAGRAIGSGLCCLFFVGIVVLAIVYLTKRSRRRSRPGGENHDDYQ